MKTRTIAALLTASALTAGCELASPVSEPRLGQTTAALEMEGGDPLFTFEPKSIARDTVVLGQPFTAELVVTALSEDSDLDGELDVGECEVEGLRFAVTGGSIRGVAYTQGEEDQRHWVLLTDAKYPKYARFDPPGATIERTPSPALSASLPISASFTCTKTGVFHLQYSLNVEFTKVCRTEGGLVATKDRAWASVVTDKHSCVAAPADGTDGDMSSEDWTGDGSKGGEQVGVEQLGVEQVGVDKEGFAATAEAFDAE